MNAVTAIEIPSWNGNSGTGPPPPDEGEVLVEVEVDWGCWLVVEVVDVVGGAEVVVEVRGTAPEIMVRVLSPLFTT